MRGARAAAGPGRGEPARAAAAEARPPARSASLDLSSVDSQHGHRPEVRTASSHTAARQSADPSARRPVRARRKVSKTYKASLHSRFSLELGQAPPPSSRFRNAQPARLCALRTTGDSKDAMAVERTRPALGTASWSGRGDRTPAPTTRATPPRPSLRHTDSAAS